MPDPDLQGTALRYAAGDLAPAAAEAFEARLAADQDARDALAEAVRLSAAALGQKSPAPGPSFRAALRARLAPRGRPAAWVALGGAAVAACTLLGLALAERDAPPAAAPRTAAVRDPGPPPAPDEHPAADAPPAPPHPERTAHAAAEPAPPDEGGADEGRTVAEIWADLSTARHVEKAHDDERRWREHVRNLSPQHVSGTARAAGFADAVHP
jgi:hypothetical protein